MNIKQGQPVFLKNNGHIGLAQAVFPFQKCVGLADNDYNQGFACGIANNTSITLSSWYSVIGSNFLATGETYYLSPDNAGMLTSTPPTSGYSVIVGQALNQTTLQVQIGNYIKL